MVNTHVILTYLVILPCIFTKPFNQVGLKPGVLIRFGLEITGWNCSNSTGLNDPRKKFNIILMEKFPITCSFWLIIITSIVFTVNYVMSGLIFILDFLITADLYIVISNVTVSESDVRVLGKVEKLLASLYNIGNWNSWILMLNHGCFHTQFARASSSSLAN